MVETVSGVRFREDEFAELPGVKAPVLVSLIWTENVDGATFVASPVRPGPTEKGFCITPAKGDATRALTFVTGEKIWCRAYSSDPSTIGQCEIVYSPLDAAGNWTLGSMNVGRFLRKRR